MSSDYFGFFFPSKKSCRKTHPAPSWRGRICRVKFLGPHLKKKNGKDYLQPILGIPLLVHLFVFFLFKGFALQEEPQGSHPGALRWGWSCGVLKTFGPGSVTKPVPLALKLYQRGGFCLCLLEFSHPADLCPRDYFEGWLSIFSYFITPKLLFISLVLAQPQAWLLAWQIDKEMSFQHFPCPCAQESTAEDAVSLCWSHSHLRFLLWDFFFSGKLSRIIACRGV